MRINGLKLAGLLGVAALMLGCANPGPGLNPAATTSALPAADGAAPDGGYTGLAQWLAWIDNPGTPGVDYDPEQITVSYLPGAVVPKGVSAVVPDAGLRAEDQPNSILRVDDNSVALTNAIAARYDIPITQQVYRGNVRVAGFGVPAGRNGDELLAAIRADFAGSVEFASYSMLFHAGLAVNDPDYQKSRGDGYSPLWTLHRIGCSDAWDFTTGSESVRVAVVDTGVRISHEELTLRVLDPATDFPDLPAGTYLDVVNGDNTMEDTYSHGTVIAGQIGAEGNNGRTIIGAAHGCEIIPIKISNDGIANDVDIIAGCLLGLELGARVINLSFGDEHANPQMELMVNDIWADGALFVGACGNDGVTNLNYPADYTNALSVGATDIDDIRTDFSNYGPGVDIAAPGIGIKSTWHTGDRAYSEWTTTGGTSFACPLVSAAAALLWSYDPALTNAQVRDLLLSTVAPTTGFTSGTVGRLDINAALSEVTPLELLLTRPHSILAAGTLNVIPNITGTPERVDCFVNGSLTESQTAEPWAFSIDTTAIQFGELEIELVAIQGEVESSDSETYIVDNTPGQFPLTEDFETGGGTAFKSIDLKHGSQTLLTAIKDIPGPGEFWTLAEVAAGGPGVWWHEMLDVYEGDDAVFCGTSDRSYGLQEIDVLVSQGVDLAGVSSPTMVFHHHFNTEDGGPSPDKAWVYVTVDQGHTFTPATLRDGGNATFAGNQPDWSTVEIDLSPFAGQRVNIVFALETDKYQGGATAPLGDLGWWIDKIAIGTDYLEAFPSFTGITVEPNSFIGIVPEVTTLPVAILNPRDISAVNFTFDFAPVGEVDDYDVSVNDTSFPFEITLSIPNHLANRRLELRITTTDVEGSPGPAQSMPLYLFNLAGDVNLDGAVDDSDITALYGLLGSTPEDPGYTVFIDANADGIIDELDAGIIGYNFGKSI